eukprot:CAMPEP_0116118874 /NCGR_PEP_ID=MMETSP0329-20121206/2341_1 /TAXON_ID=697910 /ORGANISM="Pseudo-nitzschia arenysensis, Strain B593" /LENGTH=179 /DNA_ID=CAMNT_0003612539 /DNA_START=351 /DNA_END=890 /DNA_ORIENTATION=+
MATFWTEERKKEWLKANPCRRKTDGRITIHNKGRCVNCNCCIACPAPPWCTEHKKKPIKKRGLRNFAIEDYLEDDITPAKRIRRKPPQVSPLGMVRTDRKKMEAKLDEYQKEEDEKVAEGNLLGWLFLKDLNEIENLPEKDKASEMAAVVQKMWLHLCKKDKKRARIGIDETIKLMNHN